ncbi:hypothetical protein KKH81_00840 [Patescibacteria group bacterium]|nr:hypothetical protein [Patescibacteria group bacterium]
MEDILKMDIFFVVTTLAVVAVSVCVIVVLIMLFKFLRTVDRIAEEVEEEALAIRGDIAEARTVIKREGMKAATLVTVFTKMGKGLLKRSKKSTK